MRKFFKPNHSPVSRIFHRWASFLGYRVEVRVWHWTTDWKLKSNYQLVGTTRIFSLRLTRFTEADLVITKEYSHE